MLVPPRLLDYLAGILSPSKAPPTRVYGPEELGVADWLRGDSTKIEGLKALLMARYWSRAKLPLPESSQELAYRAAEQQELLAISTWLVDLYSAPLNPAGSEVEQ